jgi:hypothetical protein
VFERELVDADVVISQPFWPAYLTEDRIGKTEKLKLAITAGIGVPSRVVWKLLERRVSSGTRLLA